MSHFEFQDSGDEHLRRKLRREPGIETVPDERRHSGEARRLPRKIRSYDAFQESFAEGAGMPVDIKPLFRPDVVDRQLKAFHLPEYVERLKPKLAERAAMLASPQAAEFKESELLPEFLNFFFYELLGYRGPTEGAKRYTISQEKHVAVDNKFADAVIGDLRPGASKYVIALEGKGPKDPLERPYAGRRLSAVEQGYRYAINLPCDWILVTSMRQTRLYFKGADQHTCERFDVETLAHDEDVLRRFVFLLGAERVVPAAERCHLYELWEETESAQRKLTREFYDRYAEMRYNAFIQLGRDNPDRPRGEVLHLAQKLLDRVLFCAFCEDRDLLPEETLKRAYSHHDPYNPKPIWDNFRGLFKAVNLGNAKLKIPPYNGGLFADDPALDTLHVSDEVCGVFRDLGEYNYRPAHQPVKKTGGGALIDVDILGHIFEQSITDLDRLRSALDTEPEPKAKKQPTRRKKEGAFYTPPFITRYIVEQAVGGALKERFERLRSEHQKQAAGTARAALDDPRVYELEKLNKPQRTALVRFWDAWQEELATVRVVDPACGSGAFLIEAFDQLYAAYEASNERLQELRGARTLLDVDRRILQSNLYGVDLNAEAVEICRLSLWIKTAAYGKQLTSLDHNIREGNSVVSDPGVHPKALDWQAAFPDVFAHGGFDVVIGNPPYVRQELLSPYKPYWQEVFQTYHGVADIFTYFFERGLEILRDGGRLAYITSGSWVRGNYGAPLRKLLAQNALLESFVDFGEFQPFPDAEMIRPSISIFRKEPPGGTLRIYKWLTKGPPPENLSDVVAIAPTMRSNHLGGAEWELEPDDVISLRQKLSAGKNTLVEYTNGRMYRGVITGLNEIFVIDADRRDQLVQADARSEELIKPFAQGTHLRPWYVEESSEFLIFARRGTTIEEYPAIREYLEANRERLEPRPRNWIAGKKWPGRKPGSYQWFEIQDSVDYWEEFDEPKIVWPDISKLPRFSMDTGRRFLGNTAYMIPGGDYFLLGILSSWATWFFISKTAQPLRLRGDRWQYRLFAQFMEKLPIPAAHEADRNSIANLAQRCCELGLERYRVEAGVQHRLKQTFGESPSGASLGVLNKKAQAWWGATLNALGDALKQSFGLDSNPLKTPKIADQWEPYLDEKRHDHKQLSRQLADAESEINDRVYRLFHLTPDEIALLRHEVEH